MEYINSKFILVLLFIVVIYFVYFMLLKHETLEQSKLYQFTEFIAGFASAFIAINLYYDVAAREEDTKRQIANDSVKLIDQLWMEPNDKMTKNYDQLGSFASELYPQLHITNRTDMQKVNMAINIFQTFDNYKINYKQNPRELTLWLRHYLQWAQSSTLQNLWPKLMHNYKSDTVKFINFLFKYANELKVKGPNLSADDYINMANQIRDEAKSILDS